ncbi:MAG: hypothetical protein LBH95_10215 [Oscillospiraceae bacterium]|jgi:hypothetical protein|nr:hypothetical protein [Oscillospiraceae bacterium]
MNDTIEKTIRYVDASLSMEGMPLTEQDKDSIRDSLSGKADVDEAVRKTRAEYRAAS